MTRDPALSNTLSMGLQLLQLGTENRAIHLGDELKEAMDTLKTTIGDEKVAMRKQVSEMEARLDDAKTKLTELNDATTRLARRRPSRGTTVDTRVQTRPAHGVTACAETPVSRFFGLEELHRLGVGYD